MILIPNIYKKPQKIYLNEIQEGGILLLDKPKSWTSFDLIKKFKYILKDEYRKNDYNTYKIDCIEKIGHAGTLDPMATGLMIICTGKFTKSIMNFQNLSKAYKGSIIIGKTTASYDLETPFETITDYRNVKEEDIFKAIEEFRGDIYQKPPQYSAIKVNGKRAYKEIRRGNTLDIPIRKVHIEKFIINNIDFPRIEFEIKCSKGTYIRSIAHDIGQQLKVGAYLETLERTQIGNYCLNDAYCLKELSKYIINS